MVEATTTDGRKVSVTENPAKTGYSIRVESHLGKLTTTAWVNQTSVDPITPGARIDVVSGDVKEIAGFRQDVSCPVGTTLPLDVNLADRIRSAARPAILSGIKDAQHATELANLAVEASCPLGASAGPKKTLKLGG